MSEQARQALVASPNTIFQHDSQRADLLDLNITKTELIALLTELVGKGFFLEFTAIKSDHHNDSALPGYRNHFNGYCADVWPLNSATAGDYTDASAEHFQDFLEAVAASPWLHQVGLAGSADTHDNRVAAGSTCFSDDGADHVHLGAI